MLKWLLSLFKKPRRARLMTCSECGQKYDPGDLDQMSFHCFGHVPREATGIKGVEMTSAPKKPPIATAIEEVDAPPRIERVEPEWYRIACGELGQAEIPGADHNRRIQEYLAVAGLPNWADETPWCAAFGAWCLDAAGLPLPAYPARARSYLEYGAAAPEPRVGDIVILARPPNPDCGHFGFFVSADADHVRLLGGNQSNCVSERDYSWSRVIGIRRP